MFSAYPRDAFVTSPSTSLAPAGLGALDSDPVGRDLLERASESAANDAPARSAPEPLWNFVSMDRDADAAQEQEHDPALERYLIEEIARAKRRRPLMKRLAHVEQAYAELPGKLSGITAPPGPPPLPSIEGQQVPSLTLPIDQLMEEFGGASTTPPPSAEWLKKARRERRRARVRATLAWIATLIIGAAIVAATMSALKG
jgi:hypothetical protein